MGDHRQKRIEEVAAEITGPIVEAIITAGANGSDGHLSGISKAKAIGEAARVIYEEVFTGVLVSLKPTRSREKIVKVLPAPARLVHALLTRPWRWSPPFWWGTVPSLPPRAEGPSVGLIE